ncbi:TetR family transcriptional regulator [Microbacterium faecale]|uniref:TetR family transcriptional regulator n=1 Tax=Microbacterium faecale TaxID=1804630 RepID=A0A916YDL8_9MICO|nr:TetR family transcriptional regulator [Microbacterium faecale]GGD41102.1 TetR family transcriptional regulator [Microbacterium faecale]
MRGTGHDLEGIVDAALELLDAFGLPDLSMRRLATHLGVQPSALYWHVENKQSLLAAVADRIVSEAAPATGVRETARALRDALLNRRDGAEVVVSTAALSLGSDALEARIRSAYEAAGSADPARDATVLAQFVLGHTYLVQQRMQAAAIGAYDADPADVAAATRADFEAGIDRLTTP